MKKGSTLIFLAIKDGSIFKNINVRGAHMIVQKLHLEDDMISFSKNVPITAFDEDGSPVLNSMGKPMIDRYEPEEVILNYDEITYFEINGVRQFPIVVTGEEEEGMFYEFN